MGQFFGNPYFGGIVERIEKTATVWLRISGGDYDGNTWERDVLERFVVYVPTVESGSPDKDYNGSPYAAFHGLHDREIVGNWREYVRDIVEHELYKRSTASHRGESDDTWENYEIVHMTM